MLLYSIVVFFYIIWFCRRFCVIPFCSLFLFFCMNLFRHWKMKKNTMDYSIYVQYAIFHVEERCTELNGKTDRFSFWCTSEKGVFNAIKMCSFFGKNACIERNYYGKNELHWKNYWSKVKERWKWSCHRAFK